MNTAYTPPLQIVSFRDAYRFLSNFYPSPVTYGASPLTYPTVEHAFQAAKTLNHNERAAFAYDAVHAMTPGDAKRAGRALVLRPDWEDVKLDVMLDLLRLKFEDPHLASLLIHTGTAVLIEGNHWGDRFWGVDGTGLNHLGLLLMQVRRELQDVVA